MQTLKVHVVAKSGRFAVRNVSAGGESLTPRAGRQPAV